MFALLAGTALSVVLVWMIQFMRLALNYAGVENLQFEDDEYYYYVRAVPKMSVAAPNNESSVLIPLIETQIRIPEKQSRLKRILMKISFSLKNMMKDKRQRRLIVTVHRIW